MYYLTNLSCLAHFPDHKKRSLKLKASKYCIVDLESTSVQGLGWKNHEGIILTCIEPVRVEKVMKEFHQGLCRGHHATSTTTHQILRSGYYWPSIFQDVYKHVRSCQPCQFFTKRQRLAALPLQPVVIEALF